ncbi:sensor histidine kinase [Paenibacillus sp. CAU 1782]
MSLFWREHKLLIAVQLLQFGMVAGLFWLDGYRNLPLVFYALFLSLLITAGYLLYHYVSRRNYYQKLQQPLQSLTDVYEKLGSSPAAEALENMLHQQYQLYQQEIHKLRRQQEEHLVFMDQWVHQMKTPLSVIELTLQQDDSPGVESIREELERMRSGLSTVLYMARLRGFRQDFHIKTVNLAKLVREVVHDNRRLFILQGVFPEVKEEDSGLVAESDEKWLFFMLSQIIGNAVKYSRSEGGKVTISLLKQDGCPAISVQDRGIGIPAADLNRVFDPFFTGQNGRGMRESTGMGLFLVKEAAKHLHHDVQVESREGEGTTLRLLFRSGQSLTNL